MRNIFFSVMALFVLCSACAPRQHALTPSATDGGAAVNATAEQVFCDLPLGEDETADSDAAVVPDEEETALAEEVEGSGIPPVVDESTPLTPQEETALQTEPAIHFDLDIRDTKDVQLYFRYYTRQHRKTFARWLKRAEPYLPYLRDEFKKQGLPQDLIFLPFAESGFNPWAYSWAGAAGMWQFMPATGRLYGLQVDWWMDERRNPYLATDAAIGYLKKLYGDFDDWYLALAAYNAGEGKIGWALRKSGCDNFFDLAKSRKYLKRETRHYVPKFLAILKIVKNLEELGFDPINWDADPGIGTVKVKGGTDLLAMATSAGLSWKEFRKLNPAFRRQVSPPEKTHNVYLSLNNIAQVKTYLASSASHPYAGYKSYRVRKGDSWWRIARNTGVPLAVLKKVNGHTGNLLRPGKQLMIPRQGTTVADASVLDKTRLLAKKRANYRVKKGDTIWDIAKQFGTSQKTLLRANGMRSGRHLRVGQKLYIPDGSGSATTLARETAAKDFRQLVRYHVRRGDNLWNIAQKFGVTTQQLYAWNNLTGSSVLRPGDRIKVYVNQ
ncbi:MAG: LysM peptidoglycan-binding domain-containing protein [Desulfoplanes sp.]